MNEITVHQLLPKVKKSQELGLKAMVCVGESLEIRESGTTNDLLNDQLFICIVNCSLCY